MKYLGGTETYVEHKIVPYENPPTPIRKPTQRKLPPETPFHSRKP